ncbi:MAG: hypothetical protein R3B45_13910 [Bdellovibrionota bacterium]
MTLQFFFVLLFSSINYFLPLINNAYGQNSPGWQQNPLEAHPYYKDQSIHGQIKLGEELISKGYAKKGFKFTTSDVIYVIAINSKVAGPPIAVVRIANLEGKTFPISFKIGPDNLMMEGGEFVGPFRLKAKLSRHGDASTQPGDYIGFSQKTKIASGSKNIVVSLTNVVGEKDGSVSPAELEDPKKMTVDSSLSSVIASGVVDLSPQMQAKLQKNKFTLQKEDVLFVIAKDAESSSKQPLAALKIGYTELKRGFPVRFKLSVADLMVEKQQKLPVRVALKVKLSRSGDVATHAGDLYSEYSDFSPIAWKRWSLIAFNEYKRLGISGS